MHSIIGVVKETLRLSSVSAMLVLLGVGVLLLYGRRTAVWGRRWLTAVVAGYWLLSIPAGAWLVALPASAGYGPITTREQAAGANAVVMLGGGTNSHVASGRALDDLGGSAYRLIETVRLYALLGDPLVVVSGGSTQKDIDPPRSEAAAYRDAAIRLGVPAERILVEDRSLTTHEEALLLKPMLGALGITRIILVTSPSHMGRSLATFRAAGFDPIGSTSPTRNEPGASFWSLIPERESLLTSDLAVYDYAAWLYYWSNGWLTR